MFRTAFAALLLAALPTASGTEPEIRTADVDRFYALYDATGGKPDVTQIQRDYLDQASDGFAAFMRMRRITAERIAATMAADPGLYVRARECARHLPAIRTRLSASLGKLRTYYPEAQLPPVTLAIGRGKPVGTANVGGVMIGLEALCAADFMVADPEDRFVHVIAHEYIHVQQAAAGSDTDTGMTVLQASLIEGGAEFIGELMSGAVSYQHLARITKGREAEFEAGFLDDIDKPAEGSRWLYDGRGTAERPGDLGYWVGYRITKAYYARARDKRAAIRAIIELRDPRALLTASGWRPGVRL
ncbi:lytic murein transglycosylase [Sphingomonas koreensis]|jgi:hypothetical protein|uniref:Lytic murein transglycosylase n=2 Tax=Sphingomonas koreensis TaxID=93064 RepID=A0A1L6J7T1_9SPHN|nr:DUF2268 domain-containing putative Zn-dependent protease [Sphingomonas koreensis]APR51876.1 hypothetical protein BRX40_05005 [Sphingomonas koreensis]MDC7812094.1 DUF2268 domain-containing putative Zn-dependent protease [Sphingomonas koreensis]RSU21494.1 lytic murein transglycosylase [Sphingomonas koreensis]RSU30847.1 lytic murein transglycosylase [Sphingomonas koreensis]RSU31942.1 lytic murein transglycosylase [Sphingomonas koreensis]